MFLLSTVLFAQDLSIGFKDGKSWTNIHYTVFETYDNFLFKNRKDGRNSGIILNYQIDNHFSVQTELNFLGKGFKIEQLHVTTGGGYYGDYMMNYISVPLSVNYEIGKKLKYYGYGGLSLNFLNSAVNNLTSTSTADPNLPSCFDNSYDPTDDFNKKEMGLIVGAGLKIPLCNNVKFFIDGRYESGLTGAVKKDLEIEAYRYTSMIKDVYNKAFSVSWGILYMIPKKEK